MKTMEKLVGTYNSKKLGNHRVEVNEIEGVRYFYYYSTIIATAYDSFMKFKIDDSYGTISTKRACNAYRFELKQMGYTEIAS